MKKWILTAALAILAMPVARADGELEKLVRDVLQLRSGGTDALGRLYTLLGVAGIVVGVEERGRAHIQLDGILAQGVIDEKTELDGD